MIEEPDILNPEGAFPGLIVVDHAGHRTPPRFGTAGLHEGWAGTHHFTDLGVAALARLLAARLDVPVILGTVSRLVIDLNRWLDDPRSILPAAGSEPIPCNRALAPALRRRRQDEIFWPYHAALTGLWARVTARYADPLFLALHSCTRQFAGARRPWDAGTIWHKSPRLARPLLAALATDTSLTLGDNQPYSGQGGVYTLDRHTWGGGHRACGVEISNDLLETAAGRDGWAERLGGGLQLVAADAVRA